MRLAQSVIASLYPRGTSLLAPGPSHKMLEISAAGSRFAHARITPQVPGAQGRIRTFVPRKEGQIYSLLALTTHPPVQTSRHARRMMQQRSNNPIDKSECAQKSVCTQTPHLEKFLMECCWEKSVTPPRRAKNALCSGTDPATKNAGQSNN